MTTTERSKYESKLRILVEHAWEHEVHWSEIESWANNFTGQVLNEDDEKLYALFTLSRFMYFGKQLIREMLKSLYRDHFESPLKQRIRRSLKGKTDPSLINKLYLQEISTTRFIGVGNPAESGAHLLYYFRQINRLPKDLFVDFAGAFAPTLDEESKEVRYVPTNRNILRYVFFDDLVGSGKQVSRYLSNSLANIRLDSKDLDLRFMSLFATTEGMEKLNDDSMFAGKAMCLFELDHSYKAFHETSRYFNSPPQWFVRDDLIAMATHYGEILQPRIPLGYDKGQLLLGFSHNTPNNSLPIFWDEGYHEPWCPIFVRYDKTY